MDQETELIERDIDGYLVMHQEKELLRLVAVGSVDDGKSTLIGRLLHDTHGVYEDQLHAVKKASTQEGMEIDFSLFTDGLVAEREQGITIDVAYRYFSTVKRKFIIADTPGHVQYTRNMATGASTANVGVILIDARLGVLQQSRRHAYIASLLGIPHLAVAVNKMDLKDYDEGVYRAIVDDFTAFARQLRFKDVQFVPISALKGDNVVHASERMPWHKGGTMLDYLERVPIAEDRNLKDFRYPVQYVLRPDLDYRGFAGEISSGVIRPGDSITVLPSRQETKVAGIDVFDGELAEAYAPMSVAIRLEDEVDVSRGDMLVRTGELPHVRDCFEAMVVWMNQQELDTEKSYLIKHTTQTTRVDVEAVISKTELETLEAHSVDTLGLNDIGRIRLRTHRPLYIDSYISNRKTGAFILIDSLTNATVANGMIIEPEVGVSQMPRADVNEPARSVRSQVSPKERGNRLGQKPGLVILCGAPASGKSAIAYALERRLTDLGRVATVLDDTGQGTSQSVRMFAASALFHAGLITIVSAPTDEVDRKELATLASDAAVEVWVNTPASLCRKRDHRGSYDQGAPAFVEPSSPALSLSLADLAPELAARKIAELLEERGLYSQ
ncbi:MAG: sulfate adenylyltransferase subunit CysN [Polyangiaceae bacterium]|nr:sulfate adenylyltransferase subunit CysN [Polyangiaceae bacterium]